MLSRRPIPVAVDPDLLPDPGQGVHGPAGPTPPRAPSSIRRTATSDMTWPGGLGGGLRIEGRARDAVTRVATDRPEVVAGARTVVGIGADRTILDIEVEPGRDGIEALVGCRGGGHLRAALDEVLPGERRAGTPLYLLLDDVSGTSLIAGVAWMREPLGRDVRRTEGRGAEHMEGVCIGFRPGSAALVELEEIHRQRRAQPVGPLVHPDDPHGWHDLAELPAVSTRRARFIDVGFESDLLVVDAGFQDTIGDREGGRLAIHEYRLRATADRETLTLRSIAPDPRVLPFRECPAAVDTSQALVGSPLAELRATVLERLPRTNGCTHLNDAMRALAEVPVLADRLSSSLG